MMELDFDEIKHDEKPVLAFQDLSDEERIKFAIAEFYEVANRINEENYDDVLDKMVARCNVILSMMHVYLSKFNNKLILDDYTDALKKGLEEIAGKTVERSDVYSLLLRKVETVGMFLGIRENLSEKISEQLFNTIMEEEKHNGGDLVGS